MNLAQTEKATYYYSRKNLPGVLIPISSIAVTIVSAFVVAAAAWDLQAAVWGLQDTRAPDWSIFGVNIGFVLLFWGLNWDVVYSDVRRDLFSTIAINFCTLVPSTLLALSTHQWSTLLRILGLVCVGFTASWFPARALTQRLGLQRNPLLSGIRTVFTMLVVACVTYLYILLPLLEPR